MMLSVAYLFAPSNTHRKTNEMFLPDRYQSLQVHRSSRCVLNSETHFKRLIFCSSLFVIPKWILLNWTRTYKSIQRTNHSSNHAPVAIDFPNQHEHHRITCTNRTHLILACTAPDQMDDDDIIESLIVRRRRRRLTIDIECFSKDILPFTLIRGRNTVI